MALQNFNQVIQGSGVGEVTRRMNTFLANTDNLSPAEVEHIMAAYAYGSGTRGVYIVRYPGVDAVEQQQAINGNVVYVNKLVDGNYLSPHCVQFVKKFRLSINAAAPDVKMNFYRIFALKFETRAEQNMFESHQRLEVGANALPVEIVTQTTRDANLTAMRAHLNTDRNYVVVTGAGVAAQLVDGAIPESGAVRSWPGLLYLLRPRMESFVGELITEYFESWYPTAFFNGTMGLMERAHMLHSMIKVYNLHNSADVDYTRFISDLFRVIRPAHPTPALAETLRALNVPIGTTNYDMLLEETMRRFEYNLPDCFQNVYSAAAINVEARKLFPTNNRLHIYHLHGVWHSKAEMTLGVEYGNSNRNFQCAIDALTLEFEHENDNASLLMFDTHGLQRDGANFPSSITKPVVFIGTGSGVFDYHFHNWLQRCNQRHYILVRASEFDNTNASIVRLNLQNKLIPVVYGAHYTELNDFIRSLPVRQ